MENTQNMFKNVFANIKLPESILTTYKDAIIKKIKINKINKIMSIELEMNKIINEKSLKELKNLLIEELQYVKEIEIYIYYRIKENIEKLISDYKKNILLYVKDRSYLCYKILENADWVIEQNNLIIHVGSNVEFLLKNKKIDTLIKDTYENRFKLNINLRFKFQDKDTSKFKYQEELEKLVELVSLEEVNEGVKETDNKNKTDFTKKFSPRSKTKVNHNLKGKYQNLSNPLEKDKEVLMKGLIFDTEVREIKNNKLLVSFDLTDDNDSITCKLFANKDDYNIDLKDIIKKGNIVIFKGNIQYDEYINDVIVMVNEICKCNEEIASREDKSEEKRVELHVHTQMSSMDGVTPVGEYIKRAKKFGHKAIGITDHAVVQGYPQAQKFAKDTGIKVVYGLEAYLVDDLGAVVKNPKNYDLNDTFIVFDIETTGLNKEINNITEIGAVKVVNGKIVDEFSSLVNPKEDIPENITKLTGITNDMVKDAPTIEEVMPKFLRFSGKGIFVAHNASFDMGFIRTASKKQHIEVLNSVLDTVELSRTLFKDLPKHKLNIIAKHLNIELKNHHRAVDDAKATAEIFIRCIEILRSKNINKLEEINILASKNIDKKKLGYNNALIMVKNKQGLKNLYKLVSKSHINYFYKVPRIPKSEYLNLKQGLMIAPSYRNGELFKSIIESSPEEYLRELVEFYDFFEVVPIENNTHMIKNKKVTSEKALIDVNKKIIELGEKYNKLVVATGNVHYLEPQDNKFRDIILHSVSFKDVQEEPELYYKTTEEMLKSFKYLSEDKAQEIVVTNTNKIADMVEELSPIPEGTFTPEIEGAEEELKKITTTRAKKVYGDTLPEIVEQRLNKELSSIISNGFAVMYIIAQKLVWKSEEDGYMVGSRGSVGSSFVATMAEITEVNPLPPHYVCSNCKYSDFTSDIVKPFAGASGYDMPDKECPVCKSMLSKDGHDIPFETFLGFDGEKEPDIDLNFSGEYQSKAHAYTEELFGADNVFKAGTIGTLADKTAYGYVLKYLEEKDLHVRKAEINRLKIGCTGIKKTTGQHPGGLMIVPRTESIYNFTPIQHPANDSKSDVITTHFDYHSISGRLLKLDLLGHDVPTIIRILQDITNIDPRVINLGDKDVISLFVSPRVLGVTEEEINCNTGTLGLPEFGTSFVRQMLIDTKPSTFSELVRISGLSHGTDVWFNNAKNLIINKVATLKEVIPTRDDIMVYLINNGVEKKHAFSIMENVRKGKGLTLEEEEIMKNSGVKDWYIESCKKIKYMFPKGHAVAYVMMTVRIGYFKIHHPYSFYAAIFSVKYQDFDYEVMCNGDSIVINEINRILQKGKDISLKEKNSLTILEIVHEMYARGLSFAPLDLYKASINRFIVTSDGLMPPLSSLQGLGESVAQNIINTREEGEFQTIDDFKIRTKANKNVMDLLRRNNIFGNLSETDQLTLF